MTAPAWEVERSREPASVFHGRDLPAPPVRAVWICDPPGPALVLGSTQAIESVDADACARAGVEVVRRRSGGGAVLVAPGRQLWADVIVPAGDPLWDADVGRSFLWLGEAWAAALGSLGMDVSVHPGPLRSTSWSSVVCFAGLGPGEVTDEHGAKVVGISQRRTREGARFQCAALRAWDALGLVELLHLDEGTRRDAERELPGVAVGSGHPPEALLAAFLAHLP